MDADWNGSDFPELMCDISAISFVAVDLGDRSHTGYQGDATFINVNVNQILQSRDLLPN